MVTKRKKENKITPLAIPENKSLLLLYPKLKWRNATQHISNSYASQYKKIYIYFFNSIQNLLETKINILLLYDWVLRFIYVKFMWGKPTVAKNICLVANGSYKKYPSYTNSRILSLWIRKKKKYNLTEINFICEEYFKMWSLLQSYKGQIIVFTKPHRWVGGDGGGFKVWLKIVFSIKQILYHCFYPTTSKRKLCLLSLSGWPWFKSDKLSKGEF